MRRIGIRIALTLIVAGASLAQAQQPGTPNQPMPRREMGPGGGMGRARVRGVVGEARGPRQSIAAMLLANTGELRLTDQQVTRLAAIARRSEDRRRAMGATIDSLMRNYRPQPGSPPPAGPGPVPAQMRTMMERGREQERADVRDALSVLSIEQQADACMLRDGGARGRGRP